MPYSEFKKITGLKTILRTQAIWSSVLSWVFPPAADQTNLQSKSIGLLIETALFLFMEPKNYQPRDTGMQRPTIKLRKSEQQIPVLPDTN
jgi:hypothetical protein